MTNRSTFRRGETTFTCDCCKRLTRNTGVQGLGSKTCPQCYELAGYENMAQDGETFKASDIAACQSEIKDLVAKGIPLEQIKKIFDLLPAECFGI